MSKPTYKELENKILELNEQLSFVSNINVQEKNTTDNCNFDDNNSFITIYEVQDKGRNFVIKDMSIIKPSAKAFNKNLYIGRNIIDAFPEIKNSKIINTFKRVWETGKSEFILLDKYEDNSLSIWKEILVYKLPNNNILSFCNDITEKMNLTEQLRINEYLYRSSIKEAPIGIISFTAEGYPIISNQSALNILGLKNDPDQTLSIIDIKNLKRIGFIRDFLNCIKTKKIIRNETAISIKKGKTIYIKYALNPLTNTDSSIHSVQAFFEDITSNKTKENELRLSENNLRTLFSTMDDFVAEIDYDGTFIYVAPTKAHMLVDMKSLVNNKIHDIFDTEIADTFLSFIRESIDSNKMMTIEYPLMINNRKVYFDGKASKKSNNSVLYIARDITKHKKTFKKLINAKNKAQKSEKEFKAITDNAAEGISVIDMQGNYLFVNPAFCNMSGYSKDELLNMSVIEVSDYNINNIDEIDINQAIKFTLYKKDGTGLYCQIIVSEMNVGSKKRLLGMVTDISELKKYEQKLIKAKEAAEQSDRLKSVFLSNMSHEIRTPMNGILGFTSLLKEPDLEPEETEQYIAVIERSGLRLLNIINDLIDISKIESGLVEIRIANFSVNEQLEYLYSFFYPEAANKNINLILDNCPKDFQIATDKEKFIAILTNLIKNAIKYSNEGNINFGYTAKDNMLTFYIKDQGIGIEGDKIETIFDRFVQADNSLASTYEGAGLGLSISQAFVELMGGKIWLESEINIGSQFYFTLPLSFNNTEQVEDC